MRRWRGLSSASTRNGSTWEATLSSTATGSAPLAPSSAGGGGDADADGEELIVRRRVGGGGCRAGLGYAGAERRGREAAVDGRRLAFPLSASRSRSGWLLLRRGGGEASRLPEKREVPSASTAPDFLTTRAAKGSAERMRRRRDWARLGSARLGGNQTSCRGGLESAGRRQEAFV